MFFADLRIGAGTCSVEISKCGVAFATDSGRVRQRERRGPLRAPIDADRLAAFSLGDRNALELSVDGAHGGNHDGPNARPVHGLQQRNHPCNTVLPEVQRPTLSFIDFNLRRKMHHSAVLMPGERYDQVVDITFNTLAATDRMVMTHRNIIEHDSYIA